MRLAPRAAALGIAVLAGFAACGEARQRPVGVDGCVLCHGGTAGNAAPPLSTLGSSDTTDPAVGAHQSHVNGGSMRGPIGCAECHVVPSRTDHANGATSVVFGPLARAHGANPVYTRATGTCASTYCHGATLGAGGTLQVPVWTKVDGTQAACGTCHAIPPLPPHPQGSIVASCRLCHPATIRADGTIDVEGGHHVDGVLDVSGGGACGACHAVPPDTGAHRVHYGDLSSPPRAEYGDLRILESYAPGGGPAYMFGCGHCHPLDPARHARGEVDLSPAGAPAGSLKARNAPGAAYDATTATCSGVYCHSNGKQQTVREWITATTFVDVQPYRTTTPWSSGASSGCGGCHDNPPRYVSGAAGAPDANTHLQLVFDDQAQGYWEAGHFGGLPGPWHSCGPRHGGWCGASDKASPITCQTCHFETIDPAATGPSGFYWLDTTGNYAIPGGQLGFACTACHGTGDVRAPAGAGGVLPLRHVNGRADLSFDPRLTLPPYAALPAAPYTPTRPVFVTHGGVVTLGPDAELVPSTAPQATLSMHLGSAAYDPATKTCSNVSCHLASPTVQWGGPTGWNGCTSCHAF
jgi:predicted CxxxxCH...CXXCH cytochrome family protein